MSRGVWLLLALAALAPALLAAPLPFFAPAVGTATTFHFSAPAPLAELAPAANQSNQSSAPAPSNAIPPVVCPLPPVDTPLGPFSCKQMLNLTEIFVILIGVTITLYVYKDADKAELPGEAVDVPVTAQEELEMRRQKDAEEKALAELEEREDA